MFIYNLTVLVNVSIEEKWKLWMHESYIPEVMETDCFTGFRFVRLLDMNEEEGATYALQFFAETIEDYNRFKSLHAPSIEDRKRKKWGDDFVSFATIMQVISGA